MTDFDDEAFALDLVQAINDVADDHDAPPMEKLAAVSVIGDAAGNGNWYSVPEDRQ